MEVHLPLSPNYSNTLYRILDAAFQLFSEQGIIEPTMDDIAKRANLSRGGVRRYFETKLLLLNTLSLEILATIDTTIIAITTDSTMPFEEQLIKLSDISDTYREYFILLDQTDRLSQKNSELTSFSTHLDNSRNQLFNFFKESIITEKQSNRQLEVYDTEGMAIFLFSIFESIYTCKFPSQANVSKDTLLNNIKLFLNYS